MKYPPRTTLTAYGLPTPVVNAIAVVFGLLMPVSAAAAEPLEILAFGDSLTAGFNLPHQDSFPARLESALKEKGYDVRVINGGVSGDTTAGGLARLDWMTAETPDAAILELGANDALRGLPPEQAKANLSTMIEKLQAKGIRVLLAGMLAPPNMGAEYAQAFNVIYADLAELHDVEGYYTFFLEGVAGQPELLLDDGMHPNPEGVGEIVRRILPKVEELLNEELVEKGMQARQ